MLEKMLRWVVILCAFILPFIVFIVATTMFFPYITGKNFAFRIIVEIMSGAWLALALVSDRYRPRRSWVLGAFALFVLVMAIADALGANPFKSFWSNFERMDGWVTLIHVFAYIVVLSSVILNERIWRLLFQMALSVSMFVSVYGFLQLFGSASLGLGGQSGLATARIDATFGNPIYLAIYMLFNVFIAALLWVQMLEVRSRGERLWPSLWYGTVIIVDTLALFFTGTRGTILGLIGGAVLTLLILAFVRGSVRLRWGSVAVLVAIVALAGGLKLAKDTAFVHSISSLDRLATISLNDSTTRSRILNMGIAWQGVKERPVLGWGQENYAIVFDKYYDPQMYAAEPWFDRVHNSIFDWLVTGGFLGLLAYLSIFASLLWLIWRSSVFVINEKAVLIGMCAGYFFHNLFVFDNVTSWILFATVIAYVLWRVYGEDRGIPLTTADIVPNKMLPVVAALMLVLVWGTSWWVNSRAMAQNKVLLQAVAAQGDINRNLSLFQEAIAYGQMGTQEAREQLTQVAVQVAGAQGVGMDVKQKFLNIAGTEMQLQEAVSPLDARAPLFLGVLFDAYGDLKDGKTALLHAHDLSPTKQSILYELATNARASGDAAGSLNYLKTAYELEKTNTQARNLYATTAIRAGQIDLADAILAEGIAAGNAADPNIANAYVSQNRFDKVATIWEAYTRVHPDDVQGYFTLAAAYYCQGMKDKAIASLQKAKTVSATNAGDADKVIGQIQSGTAKCQ